MKTLLPILALITTLATTALAEAPAKITDMRKTLSAASKEQKMAFILLGRPSCANCNATKSMISGGKIDVTATDYVMADLNIDDPKTQGEFMRKFSKEKFGEVLPFVVVTDAQGKALASSSGFKSAEQWNKLLSDAKSKVAAKEPATSAPTGKDANWPFKTPVKPQ